MSKNMVFSDSSRSAHHELRPSLTGKVDRGQLKVRGDAVSHATPSY
jgi:hypothetical protein